MPFYNAQEATRHVRAVLGPYYLRDVSSIPSALWRSWATCKFVEDEAKGESVLYYKGLTSHPKSNNYAQVAGKKQA
jgi:omega-6 fatty acid desaturase (delta-12 desaturase)